MDSKIEGSTVWMEPAVFAHSSKFLRTGWQKGTLCSQSCCPHSQHLQLQSSYCRFSSILTFPGEVKNRKHGSSFRDFFFNWRKITLQYSIGFCCTTMQIRRKCTYFTSLLSLPPLAHPSPLGYHRAPGWVLLYSNFSPAIVFFFF